MPDRVRSRWSMSWPQHDLGSNTAGTLGLTDAELDRITTGTLVIGNATTGGIAISNAITRAAATDVMLTSAANTSITFSGAGTLNAGTGTVTLSVSGSGGIVSGAGTDITASNLVITAGSGGIGASGNALTTAVSKLEAASAGGIFVSNTGGLTIGGIGAMTGVSTSGGVINISAASPLTIDEAVSNTGGGDITLSASGAAAGDDLTINANITASGGNGAITLAPETASPRQPRPRSRPPVRERSATRRVRAHPPVRSPCRVPSRPSTGTSP